MKTMIHTDAMHPNAKPVVYACQLSFPKAKGAVTPENWQKALYDLQSTPQAIASMSDVWDWERGIKSAPRKQTEPKPRTKAKESKPDLPSCLLCSCQFTPQWKNVKYCEYCRKNRHAEVKRHICRQYQKRNPDAKKARDRARHNTQTTYTNCATCSAVIALSPQSRHRLYCDECRKVKDNEQKRAHDRKRAAIYKAAVAMGVTA